MKIPQIAGEWRVLFKPEKHGNYVNDHTIVRGADGKWHLYGCTSTTGNPYDERYFIHGVGDDLSACFKEVGRSVDRGTLAWSPCVIEKDGDYYMLYGPSPTSLSVSFDMYEWFNHTVTLQNEPLMAAHRDHFVLRLENGRYLMYVSGVYQRRGAISCFTSNDLLNWQFEGYALTSGEEAPLKPGWGAMESPFVVKKDGMYYLFVTYTDCSNDTYNDTLVFCSEDPMHFGVYNGAGQGARPITKIQAHAPEIIEENGRYFITTCGWSRKPTPHKGAVSIVPLEWNETEGV